jgi:hypothetical protein
MLGIYLGLVRLARRGFRRDTGNQNRKRVHGTADANADGSRCRIKSGAQRP